MAIILPEGSYFDSNKEVNPTTGLEGKQKTPVLPQDSSYPSSDLEPNLRIGTPWDMDPTKFPFQLRPGADNLELRAQDQPAGQQILYGAGRLVSGTVIKFLEGFGYGAAAAEALFTDKTIGETVDNWWTNMFSNLEESTKEAMPIWHTNKYNQGNILQQMGTLGFWMDDAIDGVAFLASAYLGSAGINVALKGLGAYTALAESFTGITKAVKYGKAPLEAQWLKAGKIVKEMDLVTMSLGNSIVEAGFEAKDTKDQMIAEGYSNEEASAAASGTFKWNIGALMLSNYVTNSMFFGKANPMAGKIENIVDPTTNRIVSKVAPLTKGQLVGAFGKAAGLSALSEGPYEENIQQAIQDYFGRKNDKQAKGKGEAESILESMVTNFGTTEGQKAIVMGSLIGLIPGGVGGVKQVKAEKAGEKVLHIITGSTINRINNLIGAQDLDMYEGEGENRKKVIDPVTKAPVKDPIEVAAWVSLTTDTQDNFLRSVAAAENGNQIMMDRLEEQRWSSLAFGHVFHPEGVERFQAEVDNFAKDRIDKAKKDGVPIDEKAILETARKVKQKAEKYKTIYDNIVGNYAGMYDFHTSGESSTVSAQAAAVQDKAIQKQYEGAVDQMFWIDTIRDLENSKAKFLDPSLPKLLAAEQITKIDQQIKNVEATLKESEESFKKIIQEEFWQKSFDNSKAAIEEAEGKNKPIVADEKATPKDKDNNLLKLVDKDGKEYTYKGTNAAGNHVINDGKADIVQTTKEIEAKGITINDEAKTPLMAHIAELKKIITPEVTPVPPTVTEVKEQKEEEVEVENAEAVHAARKESVVEELSNRKPTKVTGAETTEEAIKQTVTESVAEKYADHAMLNVNLASAFASIGSSAQTPPLDVVYNGEQGVLFIDREENEVVFKSEKTGKETIVGKTTDEEFFSGERTMFDLNIIPLKHTVFDIEVLDAGNTLNVQGRNYAIPVESPTSVVEVDEKGLPVSVTLRDVNGVYVRFTNPTLVEELAYTVELIEYARNLVEETYLGSNEAGFVVVSDPRIEDKEVKYYVYKQSDGSYKVVKPIVTEEVVSKDVPFGKGLVKMPVVRHLLITNDKFKGIILDAYFNDIDRITYKAIEENLKEGARTTDEQRLEIQEKLKEEVNKYIDETKSVQIKKKQDEIEKLIRDSRPATPKDIIGAPDPSKVSALETATPGEVNKNVTPGTASETTGKKPTTAKGKAVTEKKSDTKVEKEIVDEVADDKATNETKTEKKESTRGKKSTDSHIEPVNTEWNRKVTIIEPENKRGLLHSASAAAIKFVDNPAADILFSDPDLDLSGYHFEPEIDYEFVDTERDEMWGKDQRTPEYLKENLDKNQTDAFDSLVDRVHVKLVLVDKDGNRSPIKGMYLHFSDYYNLLIPARIQSLADTDPEQFRKQKAQHILDERKLTRSFRYELITALLNGEQIELDGIQRGIGVLSQTPGVNRKITEITNNIDNGGDLAITNSLGAIYTYKGKFVHATGGHGNVFWVTNETANGEDFPIKLNTSKVSPQIANIILNAYIVAADPKNAGYQTLYETKEVKGGLTVGDLLRLLVVEGPMTSTEKIGDKTYLAPKTLFMATDTGLLHYGDKTLNLRKPVTEEQRQDFVAHLIANKNYSVPLASHTSTDVGLGKKLKKSFQIGSGVDGIVGRAGESYQSFLIMNGMVLTDAIRDPVTGRLFSKPAVFFNIDSWMNRNNPIPKEETTVLNKPVKEEKPVKETKKKTTKKETKPVEPEVQPEKLSVSTAESIAALLPGAEFYVQRKGMQGDEGDAGSTTYGLIDKTVYGTVVVEDGKKVFRMNTALAADVQADLQPFDGMETSNPEIKGVIQAITVTKKSVMVAQFYKAKTKTEETKPDTTDIKKAMEDIHGEEESFRLNTKGTNYTIGDVHKAMRWLRKKFGTKLTLKMEDDLLNVVLSTGSAEAFGKFKAGLITLSKRLEAGTEYHEAMHNVTLAYLSPEQRQQLYAEARKKYDLKDASDTDVNETISEKYREFEIAGGKSKAPKSKIKQFFQDIWDFIRTLVTGKVHISNLDIDNLFRVVHKSNGVLGRLRVARPSKVSVTELGSKEYLKVVKGRDLKHISSGEMLSTVVKNLVYETLVGSGVFKSKNIDKIDYRVAEAVFMEKAKRAAIKVNEFRAAGNNVGADLIQGQADIFNEILDNYGVFLQLMRDQLETLGVKTILPEEKKKRKQLEDSDKINPVDDEAEKENPEDEDSNSGFNFQRWGKASFELSGMDNAGTAIKFLIATLPSSSDRDVSTGMISFVDFDDMWHTLESELYKYDTVQEMMNVLRTKTAFPYRRLLQRLENDSKTDKFDTLRTQFLIAMRKNRYSFDHGLIDKKTKTVEIQNAETQRAGGEQAIIWGQNFFMSDMFENGLPNTSKIRTISTDYIKLYNQITREHKYNPNNIEHYEQIVTDLLELLNRISVNINRVVLDNMLVKYDSQNMSQALFNMVVDTNKSKMPSVFGPEGTFVKLAKAGKVTDSQGRERQIQNIFRNEKFFNEVVAPAYLEEMGGSVQTSILGPGGNTYQLVADNSYLTDVIRELASLYNPELFNDLINVPINDSSYLLKQLAENPSLRERISVGVFSAFTVKNAGDKGRSYEDLTALESIMLQMALFRSGKDPGKERIVFPQLGDRRHLYEIRGFKPIDFNYRFDPVSKQLMIPGEVASIFVGYAISEYNRIEKTKAEIKNAEDTHTEYKLIENYHFKYKKSKNPNIKERDYTQGNGLFYQHFTDFNGKKVSKSEIPDLVRRTLVARIQDAVNEFAKLGIITLTPTGKVGRNLMLNEKEMARIAGTLFGSPGRIDLAVENEIANYTLNSIMSTIEAEKLVFMDPAYYKDLEDKIKRYTAIASTGPTGRVGIESEILKGDRLLHDSDVFKTFVLSTQVFDSKDLREALEKKFAASFELQGLTKEEAEKKAKLKAKKYSTIDPTDGQAYITPAMFRAIHIRMGEWTQDKEDAYDLLNVTDRELTKEEQVKYDELFMQPLKYMFYGPSTTSGRMVPVYYKMSMATLTPNLVKDTPLQALYDRMTDPNDPADLVPFDTAVKVGRSQTHKYYAEDENHEPITSVVDMLSLSQITTSPLKFKYLRKQVVTDPHMETRDTVKTQVRKLILSNIVEGNTYHINGEHVSGAQLKEEYASLVSQLSTMGKDDLLEVLGIDKDTMGTIDPNAMRELLMLRARTASMSDAFIDALSQQADGENFEYDSLPDRKWIQSTLLAVMGKYTVDLKLPGTALIQMTNFGLKKAKQDHELKLMNDEGFMEAKVSVEIFRDVIPNYENISEEERLEFANTMMVGIGYRVPTQGLNSVAPLKIVGFLPSTSTATITLPSEFTALTDSDFDIDKLYFIRHNYEVKDGKAKKIEYVKGAKNSKKAIENRLVDTYFSVLLSPEHIIQNWVPLGAATDFIKDISGQVQEMEGLNRTMPSLYSASFIYQNSVKEKYLWGKKGIGPFARSIVHHVLGQIGGIHLKTNIGVGNTLEYNGNTVTDLSQTYGVDGELIQDWLSALISANVDIAKDPYIFNVNVNAATYGVGELLIRAGAGSDTFWFLSQPILKDYARLFMASKGKIKANWKGTYKTIRADYTSKMKAAQGYVDTMKDPGAVWDTSRLKEDIKVTNERDAAFYARQLQILDTFEDISFSSQRLFEAVQAVQIDTKQYGKNLSEVRMFNKLVDKVLRDGTIVNMDKVFERTFLGTLYENSVKLSQTLFKNKDIMSSDGVIALQDQIMTEIGKRYGITKADGETASQVADELYSSIVGRFMANDLGVTSEELENMMFGSDSMPSRLNQLKNDPKYVTNALIKLLAPNMTFTEGTPDFIITFSATDSKTKWAKDRITEGWTELLLDPDPTVSKFAKDLVKYAFYTSGFKRTIYSIYNFIPPAYLKEIGFSKYIGNMRERFNEAENAQSVANLRDDLYRHLWEDDEMVPPIDNNALTDKRRLETWKHPYPKMFQLVNTTASELFLGINKDYKYVFQPFVKVESGHTGYFRLYKYIGYKIKDDGTISPVYAIDSPRGYYSAGKVIKEYGLEKSIFPYYNTEMSTQDEIDAMETTDPDEQIIGLNEKDEVVYDYSNFVVVPSTNSQIYTHVDDPVANDLFDMSALFFGPEVIPNEETPSKQENKTKTTINFQEEQTTGYKNRTIKNASADATIVMADHFDSGGEKLTYGAVHKQNKKYIPLNISNVDQTVEHKEFKAPPLLVKTDNKGLQVTKERVDNIVKALNSVNAKTLNIAGNGIYTLSKKYTQEQLDNFVYDLLNQVLNNPNLKTKIESIRTGGQTGFDEAGTKAGIKLGLPVIVLAPNGWTFRNIKGEDVSNEQQFKERFVGQENDYPFTPDDANTVFSTASPEMQAAVDAVGIKDWTVDQVDPRIKKQLEETYAHCKR